MRRTLELRGYACGMTSKDLLFHLVETCADLRDRVGAVGVPGRMEVAEAAGVELDAIRRFEMEPSWPNEIEEIVRGYAAIASLRPGDIWSEALDRWDEETERLKYLPERPIPPS